MNFPEYKPVSVLSKRKRLNRAGHAEMTVLLVLDDACRHRIISKVTVISQLLIN